MAEVDPRITIWEELLDELHSLLTNDFRVEVWSLRNNEYTPLINYSHRVYGNKIWKKRQHNSGKTQQSLAEHELTALKCGRPSELFAVRVTTPQHHYLQKPHNCNPDIKWIRMTKNAWNKVDTLFQQRVRTLGRQK